jgi:hypothetical protein
LFKKFIFAVTCIFRANVYFVSVINRKTIPHGDSRVGPDERVLPHLVVSPHRTGRADFPHPALLLASIISI